MHVEVARQWCVCVVVRGNEAHDIVERTISNDWNSMVENDFPYKDGNHTKRAALAPCGEDVSAGTGVGVGVAPAHLAHVRRLASPLWSIDEIHLPRRARRFYVHSMVFAVGCLWAFLPFQDLLWVFGIFS